MVHSLVPGRARRATKPVRLMPRKCVNTAEATRAKANSRGSASVSLLWAMFDNILNGTVWTIYSNPHMPPCPPEFPKETKRDQK